MHGGGLGEALAKRLLSLHERGLGLVEPRRRYIEQVRRSP